MSFGRMSWEPPESPWKPDRDKDWFDDKFWFVEEMTGTTIPYDSEIDRFIGPMFRMFWQQPHEWQWFRPWRKRGSNA